MKVSLYSSPASIPFNFARHTWLVVDDGLQVDRYEIFHYLNDDPDFGYTSLNCFPKDSGIERIHGWNCGKWKATLLGEVNGESAEKLAEITKNSFKNYKNKYYYRVFPGPNSNTYIQWILDQVPECGLKLPWNAFGKDFPH